MSAYWTSGLFPSGLFFTHSSTMQYHANATNTHQQLQHFSQFTDMENRPLTRRHSSTISIAEQFNDQMRQHSVLRHNSYPSYRSTVSMQMLDPWSATAKAQLFVDASTFSIEEPRREGYYRNLSNSGPILVMPKQNSASPPPTSPKRGRGKSVRFSDDTPEDISDELTKRVKPIPCTPYHPSRLHKHSPYAPLNQLPHHPFNAYDRRPTPSGSSLRSPRFTITPPPSSEAPEELPLVVAKTSEIRDYSESGWKYGGESVENMLIRVEPNQPLEQNQRLQQEPRQVGVYSDQYGWNLDDEDDSDDSDGC